MHVPNLIPHHFCQQRPDLIIGADQKERASGKEIATLMGSLFSGDDPLQRSFLSRGQRVTLGRSPWDQSEVVCV